MKLGIGAYQYRPELAADANAVNASAVLLFQRALDLAYQIEPGIEIIGREFWSTADQDAMLLSLDLEGLRTLGEWQANSLCRMWPRVHCWQGLNEVMRAGHLDWLQRQVAFELGFADGCAANGKTMCAINAPPGVEPTPESEPEFFPLFAETIRPLMAHPAVKYWGRHVYSKHRTAHLWDDPDWFALRHRQIVAGLMDWQVDVPPIAVTELGWADGWRAAGFEDYQAADDLDWFAAQVQDDADIAHLMVFCDGDSGGWADHDVHGTGIIGRMADWNEAHPVQEQPEEDIDLATLREQFPDIFEQWEVAGGVENNFRAHLIGIGALAPSSADLQILAGNAKAAVSQLENAALALFAPKA